MSARETRNSLLIVGIATWMMEKSTISKNAAAITKAKTSLTCTVEIFEVGTRLSQAELMIPTKQSPLVLNSRVGFKNV